MRTHCVVKALQLVTMHPCRKAVMYRFACRQYIEVHKVAHICILIHAHHARAVMRIMFCGAANVVGTRLRLARVFCLPRC